MEVASFPGSTVQLFFFLHVVKSWAVEPGNEASMVDGWIKENQCANTLHNGKV